MPIAMTAPRPRQVELVGRKIRQLRKERKLTQSELASRIGIQQSDLSRIERGEYRVSLDILFRMLAEFRVSVGEFFEENDGSDVGPREVLMVQRFNALPQGEQKEVQGFITRRRDDPGRHRRPGRPASEGGSEDRG